MFNKEEEQLMSLKEKHNNIPVPDQIDQYINVGLEQAQKSKKRNHRAAFSAITVAAILFLFIVSVRISPAFASYASQIAGLDRLVELIRGDKGLESAIKNNFVQVIGKSATHDGITFTIDEIIVDETKMIVFYTLEADEDLGYIMLSDLEITDEADEEISIGYSYGSPSDDFEKGKTVSEKIDIDFGYDENIPEQINLSAQIDVGKPTSYPSENKTWDINFTIDHDKFADYKDIYSINETVIVEEQKITFKEIIVYPTKIAIHVKYDEQNSKELFGFDDLAIINENGEEWASIMNGVTGQEVNDHEEILYLQSNFFEQPTELHLQFSSIRALDKDKLDVIVDLENEQLLKRPNNQLELFEISTGNSVASLDFKIKRSEEYIDDIFHQIFAYHYHDEAGNEYETHNGFGFHTGDDESEYISYLKVSKPDVGSNVILKITDYPTRISMDIKIKVK